MTCCMVVPGISFRVGLHLPWVDGVSVALFSAGGIFVSDQSGGEVVGGRGCLPLCPPFGNDLWTIKMLEYLYLPASNVAKL